MSDILSYEDFLKRFTTRLNEMGVASRNISYYPKGYTSDDPERIEWIKETNKKFMGVDDKTALQTDILALNAPGEEKGPELYRRIAIRKLFEDARKDGFDAAFKRLLESGIDLDGSQLDSDRLHERASGNYEKIRDHLILRPLNYEMHATDLETAVYKKVSDFVLCLYQIVGDQKSNFITSKIRRYELDRWGMADQEDQIFLDALNNTARLYPPCVFDRRTQREENFLKKEFTKEDITVTAPNSKQLLLSTFKTTNGAVALFYPGVIGKMMKIMGGPFQAVFMNINDVMIFSSRDKAASRFVQVARTPNPSMGQLLSKKVLFVNGRQMIPGITVPLTLN